MKIKCFFGKHDWIYTSKDLDGFERVGLGLIAPTHKKVKTSVRYCNCCFKIQYEEIKSGAIFNPFEDEYEWNTVNENFFTKNELLIINRKRKLSKLK